jgi:hypothetical protein
MLHTPSKAMGSSPIAVRMISRCRSDKVRLVRKDIESVMDGSNSPIYIKAN